MERKGSGGQSEAFFEQGPHDGDLNYLKNYVKDHPDNKMGWYLLGKEYSARNKQGKANYCFAQAGEVYEAFEKRKVTIGLPDERKISRPVETALRARRSAWSRAARLAAVLFMAVLIGSILPAGGDRSPDKERKEQTVSSVSPASSAAAAISGFQVFYTHPLENPGETDAIWKKITGPHSGTEPLPASVYLLRGLTTTDGKWIDWLRTPVLVMSGERSSGGDQLVLRYRDAETCNCKPEPGPETDRKAEEAVRSWMAQQEELAVLQSAIRSYMVLYGGDLPKEIDGLIRDFPMNLLPGYTSFMRESYPAMAESIKAASSAEGNPSSAGMSGAQNGKLAEALAAPLEIKVDKLTHRLALISGSVILRSYPVGLGGAKTPEGEFRITDKVRNPNGRDDGDFGSRGMQLSDTAYAIHGTNQPKSIGEDRSLGCVRMLKEDIEELFDMVPAGTKVTIGQGLVPADTIRRESPFRVPRLRVESNPGKTYRWL